ncbi:MAG: SIMPL domain-containing protein [Nanoarchaeota archaeon]
MELGKNAVLVILLVAFLLVGAYVFVNSDMEQNVISAQGSAEITTEPEIVSVYISIETLNDSAQISKDENAEITDNVITELIKLGFDRDEIQTENFNVYEEFDWAESGRKSKGWKTTNSIIVKTENFQMTGAIVDTAVDSGALIQNINFELTEETENDLKAQALEQAAQDAKTKAEALARGSGGKLGSLVSVASQESDYYPWPIYARAEGSTASLDAKAAATNIQPKDLTVSAIVQATYKIR